VTPFEASKFKITNEEFFEFINAKGYENPEYWTEEGWRWAQYKQAKHPSFWVCPNNCKSGCGGAIKAYSHCQECHFTESELNFIRNGVDDDSMKETFRRDIPYK
jgi:hypothetical protein